MMHFANQMIAKAISEIYFGCNITAKIEELLKSSRWFKSSPLFTACKKALPPSSTDRTIQAHLNKFFTRLCNNKKIITQLILNSTEVTPAVVQNLQNLHPPQSHHHSVKSKLKQYIIPKSDKNSNFNVISNSIGHLSTVDLDLVNDQNNVGNLDDDALNEIDISELDIQLDDGYIHSNLLISTDNIGIHNLSVINDLSISNNISQNDDIPIITNNNEEDSTGNINAILQNNLSIFNNPGPNNESLLANDEKEDDSIEDKNADHSIEDENAVIQNNSSIFKDPVPNDELLLVNDEKEDHSIEDENLIFENNQSMTHHHYYTPITEPFVDITIHAETEGAIDHDPNDIHRRNCNGAERVKVAAAIQQNKPGMVKFRMLNNADKEVLQAVNRNHVLSSTILHKISSENRAANDLDKDLINATGSLIAPIKNVSKRILYYVLSLPGKHNEYGPCPVAEFISTVHDAHYQTIFLSTVMDTLSRFTKKKLIVDKVESDFCLAGIQAIIMGFNRFTLKKYLEIIHDIAVNEKTTDISFTVVHICSTHFLNTVRRKLKECSMSKATKKLALHWISQLVHCTSIEEAKTIFNDGCIVFGKEWSDENLDMYVKKILPAYEVTKTEKRDEVDDDDDDNEEN
ncbi:hypothetical protein KQX54_016454 [Cotesia glomerata]|uniref:Uncharacterized protein n=1 Tax=Cotesia glomerata TaxID=32391 RepID=A0AAV7J4U5_COTGL|nr:hypothetical protein KQX54_016454 [Cotesia glomerata]